MFRFLHKKVWLVFVYSVIVVSCLFTVLFWLHRHTPLWQTIHYHSDRSLIGSPHSGKAPTASDTSIAMELGQPLLEIYLPLQVSKIRPTYVKATFQYRALAKTNDRCDALCFDLLDRKRSSTSTQPLPIYDRLVDDLAIELSSTCYQIDPTGPSMRPKGTQLPAHWRWTLRPASLTRGDIHILLKTPFSEYFADDTTFGDDRVYEQEVVSELGLTASEERLLAILSSVIAVLAGLTVFDRMVTRWLVSSVHLGADIVLRK
jgi:hypothetical protein